MNAKCCWCHICGKELENAIPDHLEVRIRSGSTAPLLEEAEVPYIIKQLLPEGHSHTLCHYAPLEIGFTAFIKLQLSTREEAEMWLEDFQRSSGVTLRVEKTYPVTEDTTRRNGYRVDMKCQHSTKQMGSGERNTQCPAGLYLVLKKSRHSQNRKSRSSDAHIQQGFLLHVTIKHHHNHPLASAKDLPLQDAAREKQGEVLQTRSEMTPPQLQSEQLEGRLRAMFEGLMDKLKKDKTFQAPIESFVSNYEQIHSDSSLIPALCAFGETRSAAARHNKMLPRKVLQMSTETGVQPTAISCRKTPLEGRPSLISGRPPKRAWREQGNGKVEERSQCVSAGVSLGQHSDYKIHFFK